MKQYIEKVIDFHKAFGLYYAAYPENKLANKDRELRIHLINEEAKEVEQAINKESLDQIAKELSDLLYVTYGAIAAFGLQDKIEDIFSEVHRSNMSKLGPDGKPIYNKIGKVVKPKNYSKADVKSLLN